MTLERVCRALAILIAVAAVIDPEWVVAREAPVRAVITRTAGATDADVERVRNVLPDSLHIEPGLSPSTAARLVVGRTVPALPDALTTFVVTPAAADAPEIRAISVAHETSLDAVAQVIVSVAIPPQSRTSSLEVSLLSDGVPVETVKQPVGPDAATVERSLSFVPSRVGLARLRVSAKLGDGPETHADAVTEVTRRSLRILFYDARPSWAATFLRRVLEDDPRLDVTVRSVTSRGVAADAGAPPASLERAEELTTFDVVVVSTPEVLSDRSGAALETYLREREGAVVILPGEQNAALLSRLTGVATWTLDRRPALDTVTAPAGAWTASEFLWPATLPPGAEALTSCAAPGRCAAWRSAVGGGRVIVSSALDGWRTRDAESSAFAGFWRSLIGDEAAATPRPIDIALHSRTVEPRGLVAARIDAAGIAGALRAEWQSVEGIVQPVRLWERSSHEQAAEFRAPAVPGRYRLVVTGAGNEARAEFLVVEPGQFVDPLPGASDHLAAFASSRGGAVIPMAELDTLPARLSAAVPRTPSDIPSHPMRSPWWTLPFAGLLATEWWSRRRRGAR